MIRGRTSARRHRRLCDRTSLTPPLSRARSRLTAAATSFVERYATTFGPPLAAPTGWTLVVPQQPAFEFVRGDEGAFVCTVPWSEAFSPHKVYRFHKLPGAPAGLTFKIDASVVGKAFQVSVQSTVAGGAFTTYNNLLEKLEEADIAPTEVCEPVDMDALLQTVPGLSSAPNQALTRHVFAHGGNDTSPQCRCSKLEF